MNKTLQNTLLALVLIPVLGGIIWCGYQVKQLSAQRAAIRKDYSELNNIQYGLLSVDAWRDNITGIVNEQIDAFDFSDMQEDTLRAGLNKVLNALVTRADHMVNQKQKTFKNKIKQIVVKQLVDVDKVREKVPEFSQTIINELKKPSNREKVKFLAKDKLKEFADKTHDSIKNASSLYPILERYGQPDIQTFNAKEQVVMNDLQARSYNYTFVIIGCLSLMLLLWFVLRNQAQLHKVLFVMSVLMAMAALFTGLLAPMIEIDARIKELSFTLIGKHLEFHDQVLFFQSKSITDVVHILLATGKPDSIVVGVLILIFSVLFPITKLICTQVYMMGGERVRKHGLVKFFAFKSGKWSMADVMVVAIFMAYIGFKGILDTQLGHMSTHTKSLTTIATNQTSLQPGFILFICYVLFGLILGAILKKITLQERFHPMRQLRKLKLVPKRYATKMVIAPVPAPFKEPGMEEE